MGRLRMACSRDMYTHIHTLGILLDKAVNLAATESHLDRQRPLRQMVTRGSHKYRYFAF